MNDHDLTTREDLSYLIAAEIDATGWSQKRVAQLAGVSTKHLSMLVSGQGGMSLDTAARVLAVCGRRIVLTTEPLLRQQAVRVFDSYSPAPPEGSSP
jgi:transcriptional regulator with XRE-family HTH domain